MYTSPTHNNYYASKIKLTLPSKPLKHFNHRIQKEIHSINTTYLNPSNKAETPSQQDESNITTHTITPSAFDAMYNTAFAAYNKSTPVNSDYFSFRNRPMINTNQRRFDFNAKKYVLTSPTNRAVFAAKLFEDGKGVEKGNDYGRKGVYGVVISGWTSK